MTALSFALISLTFNSNVITFHFSIATITTLSPVRAFYTIVTDITRLNSTIVLLNWLFAIIILLFIRLVVTLYWNRKTSNSTHVCRREKWLHWKLRDFGNFITFYVNSDWKQRFSRREMTWVSSYVSILEYNEIKIYWVILNPNNR